MLTIRFLDRVFGHALNTVNKIRPGSQKPPTSDRLSLYGLYKQAMEGDVSAIADRPTVVNQPSLSPDQLRKEHEKWDAWKDNESMSRTEAKRRYIEKLIDTMHQSPHNEALAITKLSRPKLQPRAPVARGRGRSAGTRR